MPRERAQCGNPLFLSWIEELRDAARDKGTKAAESYGKAARSVSSCPTPFTRPRDLIVLQGVGPKIVHILEGKWRTYCEENGLPAPGTPEKSKGKQKAVQGDVDSDSEQDTDAVPPPKKRKASKPKVYIPAKGSGGYGLLLGLVLAIDRPEINTQVFLTKGELIRISQPYSDSSYEHSEKGTYFTAWSSMKTLIGKGYVYVTGNPHKYCLTPEGYQVAVSIRALLPEFQHLPRLPWLDESIDPLTVGTESTPQARVPSVTLPPSPPATVSDASLPRESTNRASVSRVSVNKNERFGFWYIDSAGHRVDSLDQATGRLDPEQFVTLKKVEFMASQLGHRFVSHLRLVDTSPRTTNPSSGEETVFAYIKEDDAPPKCSRFYEEATSTSIPASRSGRKEHSTISDDDDDDDWVRPVSGTMPPSPRPPKASFTKTISAPVVLDQESSRAPFPMVSDNSLLRSASTASVAGPSKARPQPRLSSHIPVSNPLIEESDSIAPVNLPSFTPADAIIFPAGTYDVILILDTREVESKTNRDKIGEKLLDKGVNVETRALRLGDMCWIARRRDGVGGEEDECVLDYVVERKRLDDLCHSIKDGRYNEQCFRLANSCINHVFYIVEDWNTSHNMEFSGLQIMTAKSQIQVHNQFLLQETNRLSETIDFLTTMTRIIISSHKNKDLHIIPTRFLSRSSYRDFKKSLSVNYPAQTFLTSWQGYQDLNDKNASRTLKETFARMLMCIKGMSAEKVSAILDVYETPRAMWEALRARQEEEKVYLDSVTAGSVASATGKSKAKARRGPELFFADKLSGEGRRKIGDALSRDVYRAIMGSGGGGDESVA
ncbi:hypothetical protein BD324DRAFT_639692 [Kockovaella imperatae]|uniref:Crossover junction endonuclease MUS81 n=1 Tax=Kockovaella imperatae TaxID=4999 RepID=A0A1Y1U5Z4_9TREE|nr:hypothetical protein BD324DRAFT_639692 [Kockovaella imperatae]ORX33412.1 hypothetical protein BD324DRAFT_639692 [Kockovaella imperatae]